MRIAELVEAFDLPQTEVAERAWVDAQRRVRRRRGAVAAGAAALAVACVVLVAFVAAPAGHHTAPTPGPAPTHTVGPHSAPLVQRLLTGGHWRTELADLDRGRFAGNLKDAVPLSSDPVDRAALAMGDPDDEAGALVLGEDGVWRRVDVPGLVPVRHGTYTRPILRPTSLSPDATRLALPQPNALVVVDLAKGTSRRYAVPGAENEYPIWIDEAHLLLVPENSRHGTVVDLLDGSLTPSPYGPWTRFVGGTTLTWGRGGSFHSTLVWGDGRRVRTDANNGAGFFPEPPLVKDDIAVGIGGIYAGGQGFPFGTLGFIAVDGTTGKVLAYLPIGQLKGTTAELLGWSGDRPIIGVPLPQASDGLFVFAWDWRAGELDPIGHVGDWTSWGTGVVRE